MGIMEKVGVVVAAGRMAKTVTVRVAEPVKDTHLRKTFTRYSNHLAHDERTVCTPGDIVTIHPIPRTSSTKRHTITSIQSAFHTGAPRGTPESLPEYKSRKELAYEKRMLVKLKQNPGKYMFKYKGTPGEVGKVVKEMIEVWKKEKAVRVAEKEKVDKVEEAKREERRAKRKEERWAKKKEKDEMAAKEKGVEGRVLEERKVDHGVAV
ncbi:hypothetical protein DFH27DRAFT_567661 [Peziza echinospora]|nr:hypothetical protein DFH27DRAFT_567661 [Peziza echinospora]